MKSVFFILFLCCCLFSFGQKATISGYIADNSSGEKLIGASVYDGKTLVGTTTNLYGFFSLTLDTGEVILTISYVGYGDITESIDLKEDVFRNVALEVGQKLEEVVISASSSEKIHEQTQMSAIKIPIN